MGQNEKSDFSNNKKYEMATIGRCDINVRLKNSRCIFSSKRIMLHLAPLSVKMNLKLCPHWSHLFCEFHDDILARSIAENDS